MPIYTIRDPSTGREVDLEGDAPPTAEVLKGIFSRLGPVEEPIPQEETNAWRSEAVPGLSVPGNIDLQHRPRVQNADGTTSTIRSISFGIDGKEVLMPTVSEDGRIMSDDEALATYKRTGKHLGIFNTPEEATAYGQRLHEEQAAMGEPTRSGQWTEDLKNVGRGMLPWNWVGIVGKGVGDVQRGFFKLIGGKEEDWVPGSDYAQMWGKSAGSTLANFVPLASPDQRQAVAEELAGAAAGFVLGSPEWLPAVAAGGAFGALGRLVVGSAFSKDLLLGAGEEYLQGKDAAAKGDDVLALRHYVRGGVNAAFGLGIAGHPLIKEVRRGPGPTRTPVESTAEVETQRYVRLRQEIDRIATKEAGKRARQRILSGEMAGVEGDILPVARVGMEREGAPTGAITWRAPAEEFQPPMTPRTQAVFEIEKWQDQVLTKGQAIIDETKSEAKAVALDKAASGADAAGLPATAEALRQKASEPLPVEEIGPGKSPMPGPVFEPAGEPGLTPAPTPAVSGAAGEPTTPAGPEATARVAEPAPAGPPSRVTTTEVAGSQVRPFDVTEAMADLEARIKQGREGTGPPMTAEEYQKLAQQYERLRKSQGPHSADDVTVLEGKLYGYGVQPRHLDWFKEEIRKRGWTKEQYAQKLEQALLVAESKWSGETWEQASKRMFGLTGEQANAKLFKLLGVERKPAAPAAKPEGGPSARPIEEAMGVAGREPATPPAQVAARSAEEIQEPTKAKAQEEVGKADEGRYVTEARRREDIIYLSFDMIGKVPTAKELTGLFKSKGYDVRFIGFHPDITSTSEGVMRFEGRAVRTEGRSSSSIAESAFKDVFGQAEDIHVKSRTAEAIPLQERFSRTIAEYARREGGAARGEVAKPTAPAKEPSLSKYEGIWSQEADQLARAEVGPEPPHPEMPDAVIQVHDADARDAWRESLSKKDRKAYDRYGEWLLRLSDATRRIWWELENKRAIAEAKPAAPAKEPPVKGMGAALVPAQPLPVHAGTVVSEASQPTGVFAKTKLQKESRVVRVSADDLFRDRGNDANAGDDMRKEFGEDWKSGIYVKAEDYGLEMRIDKPELNLYESAKMFARDLHELLRAGKLLTRSFPNSELPPAEPLRPGPGAKAEQTEVEYIRKQFEAVDKWAKEEIRKKLGGTSANPFLDPKFMAAVLVRGAGHVERGLREFGAWANEMRKEFGTEIEPYLKNLHKRAVAMIDAGFKTPPLPQQPQVKPPVAGSGKGAVRSFIEWFRSIAPADAPVPIRIGKGPTPRLSPYADLKSIVTRPFGTGQIPIIGRLFDPRYRGGDEVGGAFIVNAYSKNVGANLGRIIGAEFAWANELFRGLPISDIAEAWQRDPGKARIQYRLSAEQERALRESKPILEDILAMMAEEGIPKAQALRELFEGQEHAYFPRTPIGKVGVDTSGPGTRSIGLSRNPGFLKERIYRSETQGAEAGKIYEPEFSARLADHVTRAYSAIANHRLTKDPSFKGETVQMRYEELADSTFPELDLLKRAAGSATYPEEGQALMKKYRKAFNKTRQLNSDIFSDLHDQAEHVIWGVEGVVRHLNFQGWIFPKEISDKINAQIAPAEHRFVELLKKASTTSRAFMLALDNSAILVQGLPVLFWSIAKRNNVWGRAVAANLRAWMNPEYLVHELAKPGMRELAREFVQYGSSIGRLDDYMTGAAKGQVAEQLPVIGKAFRHAGGAFGAFLDMAKLHLWKAVRETAKTGEERRVLAESIENALGNARTRAIGMHPSTLDAMSIAELASSYYRSAPNLVAAMFTQGASGKLAREMIGAFAGGVILTSAAAMWTAGLTPKEILDKFKRMDLTFPVPWFGGKKINVGFAHILLSLAKLTATSIAYVADDKPISGGGVATNPFLRWLWSHSGPVPSATTEIITGRDFLGQKTSITKTLLKRVVPISAGQFLETAGKENTRTAVGDALPSFLGLNAWPQSFRQEYAELANAAAQSKFKQNFADLDFERQATIARTISTNKVLATKPVVTPLQVQAAVEADQKRRQWVTDGLTDSVRKSFETNNVQVRGFDAKLHFQGADLYLPIERQQDLARYIAKEYNARFGSEDLSKASSEVRQKQADSGMEKARANAKRAFIADDIKTKRGSKK